MQLTRFDRWLRRKFVHETHIYTMRQLPRAPRGVRGFKLPEKQGQRFHYKYVTRSENAANAFVSKLNEEGMMFNTQVVDRDTWYASILAPKAKSPTWWLISMVAFLMFTVSALYFAARIWADPEMRKNILDALDILRG